MPGEAWERAGEIGIDAGLCWIGDPCYILPEESPEAAPLRDWSKFCEMMKDLDVRQFRYLRGHDGLGVCVSTGCGDGIYPVEVRRDPDGRIAEVRVRFIDDEPAIK